MGIVETLPESRPPYTAPRPIEAGDTVEAFDCGKGPLNDFLTQRALKNEGRASRTYVVSSAAGAEAGHVVAYYSLAMGAVTFGEAPNWAKRNMPNPIPVVVLCRLAVDRDHQRKGIAAGLLRDAFQRALEAARHAGSRAMVVHAIDDEAIGFYTPYGFQRFPTDSRTMFLPMETLAASL